MVQDTRLLMQPTYGIVGQGRVASHFTHYLHSLGLAHQVWHRQHPTAIEKVLHGCDAYLILINDDAIEEFLKKHPFLLEKPCIHFSGSLTTELAQGFHPHCNFTSKLYDPSFYPKIPFVIEKGAYGFKDIFPTLKNQHFTIDPKDRAKYHALCVMTGNFPTLLWQNAQAEYEALGLPSDFFHVYIQNIVDQFTKDPEHALTGPFARNDTNTIDQNIKSLEGSALQKIYQSFAQAFHKPTK